MENQDFTAPNLADNNARVSVDNSQPEPGGVIKLNEKLPVTKKFKIYISIYIYFFVLIFSLFLSNSYRYPFAGFLITVIILGFLGYLFVDAIYESMSFLVTNNSITANWGIFVKKSKTVLFDTVQTMDSKGGLIMGMCGIVEFRINITSPSQININSGSATKAYDFSVVLSSDEADWLANFISRVKSKKLN